MPRKRLFPVFVIAGLVAGVAATTPVAARWANPATVGYCAWGTCNRLGGIRAGNVKFCKPENCRDFVATNAKPVAATRKAPCQVTAAPAMLWPWSWIAPRRDCRLADEK
jgi:hypothetical protein